MILWRVNCAPKEYCQRREHFARTRTTSSWLYYSFSSTPYASFSQECKETKRKHTNLALSVPLVYSTRSASIRLWKLFAPWHAGYQVSYRELPISIQCFLIQPCAKRHGGEDQIMSRICRLTPTSRALVYHYIRNTFGWPRTLPFCL